MAGTVSADYKLYFRIKHGVVITMPPLQNDFKIKIAEKNIKYWLNFQKNIPKCSLSSKFSYYNN